MDKPTKVNPTWISRLGRYVLRWHDGRKDRQENTDIFSRRDRAAARTLANQLEDKLAAAMACGDILQGISPSDATKWDVFCSIYEREHISTLTVKSQQNWDAARKAVESIIKPNRIADITSAAAVVLMTRLDGSPATRGTRIAYIRHAMRWAERIGLLDRAPLFTMPKGHAEPATVARTITQEEFERIIDVAKARRNNDFNDWRRLLLGLWHSGMRISELLKITWEPGPIVLDGGGKFPVLVFTTAGQKNRKSQVVPVTPEFWTLARETKHGRVFPLNVKPASAIRVVNSFGQKAGVVVDPATGATATSKDIGRRAFASRWSSRLPEAMLSALMRHSSGDTTRKHYIRQEMDVLAEKLWEDTLGEQSG